MSKAEMDRTRNRGRVETFARRAAYVALSRRSRPGGRGKFAPMRNVPQADFIRIAPGISSRLEAADLAARINWYLVGFDRPIVVDGADSFDFAEGDAPWMDPGLVRDPGWISDSPHGVAHDVVHRLTAGGALRIGRSGPRSTLAAPEFSAISDLGWFWLRWGLFDMPRKPSPEAVERLFRMQGAGSAFVLATGPSAALVDPEAVDSEVRISCNSIVRDADLLSALRPNVICFNDPCFHFGPSRYAAAFRRDLLRAVDELDPLLVTGDYWGGLLLAHHPELRDRLVTLEMMRGGAWHWPTRQALSARMTGNVLTNAMLPVAFALADTVEVAGCDGRQPQERYFWQHNPRTQYEGLMDTVAKAHPAFFADSDYERYYDTHCEDLAAYIAVAEDAGKSIVPVTPSFIPALRERGASVPVVPG